MPRGRLRLNAQWAEEVSEAGPCDPNLADVLEPDGCAPEESADGPSVKDLAAVLESDGGAPDPPEGDPVARRAVIGEATGAGLDGSAPAGTLIGAGM